VSRVPQASSLKIQSRKYFQGVLQNISKYGLLETETSESLKESEKKLRPLADVGTQSHRHGLQTPTSYDISGKSMTNYKGLLKLLALKEMLNFLMFLLDPGT